MGPRNLTALRGIFLLLLGVGIALLGRGCVNNESQAGYDPDETYVKNGMTYYVDYKSGIINLTLDSLWVEKLRWELDMLKDEHGSFIPGTNPDATNYSSRDILLPR